MSSRSSLCSYAVALLVLTFSMYAAGASAQGPESNAPASPLQALHRVGQHDRVNAAADFGNKVQLGGHLPAWVRPRAQSAAKAVDLNAPMKLVITLQRDPAVQAAFEKLLADQQDRSSPLYHQWLTPQQIGDLYGPTQNDVDAVVSWLSAQGLTVESITPSRMQINVNGSTSVVANAFRTSFAYYKVGDEERLSAVSSPFLPAALAPVVLAIDGLTETISRPQHHVQAVAVPFSGHAQKSGDLSPQYSSGSTHYVTPGDFNTIYDLASVVSGGNTGATIGPAAQHIAIIGRSRVAAGDISYFNSLFLGGTYNLNTIVASPGSDPGTTSNGDQGEATLDVQRVIGTAHGAQADLVVSASSGTDGVTLAMQYNVNTLLDPIMSVSFGLCEANVSPSNITSMDTFFSQAAAEGIATFVSSGDSGAAGCDTSFTAPPASQTISPNYLCASSYVTCVGGTEFNDTANPSAYWSSTNTPTGANGLESALSYIPEGAWNEPGSSGSYIVAGTGGGVSSVITKPSFQTGTGVPADGHRDTPDLAFTSAGHDGYIGCLAYSGADCSTGYITVFSGTSAAAPGMAGIAALLNTKLGAKQGNLNPTIYRLAATTPSAFHDVTVTSSGVSGCANTTPSMCNNSTPGSASSLTGGAAGYLVTTGYDLATGWGSLDVANFLNAAGISDFTVTSSHSGNFKAGDTGDTLTLTATNSGGITSSGTVTVTDTLPSGLTATALSGSGWNCTVASLTCTRTDALAAHTSYPAITLMVSVSSSAVGTYTNTVAVSGGSETATSNDSATDSIGVIGVPTISEGFSPNTVAPNVNSTVTFTLGNPSGNPVSLTGVGFSDSLPTALFISTPNNASTTCTSGSVTATAGTTSILLSGATITAGSTCTVTVNVTSPSIGTYNNVTGTVTATNSNAGGTASATLTVTVTPAKLVFTSTPPSPLTAGGNSGTVRVALEDTSGNIATNDSTTSVTLTVTGPSSYSQQYTITATNGVASFNLSSVSLTVAGTYTYTATSGALTQAQVTQTVNPGTASGFTVTGLSTFTAPQQAQTATVRAVDGYGNVVTGFTGAVTLSSTDTSATFSPTSHTYVAGDAGVYTFTVTFNTAGTFSVTATSSSLTGSQTNILVQDSILILNRNDSLARLTDAGVQTGVFGSTSGTSTLGAVSLDITGGIWATQQDSSSIARFYSNGTSAAIPSAVLTAAGVNSPVSIFLDGYSYAWIANGNGSISEITHGTLAVSPSTGYQPGALSSPTGIIVDNSGAVWVTNGGNSTVTKVFGGAAPVLTPLVNAISSARQGAQP